MVRRFSSGWDLIVRLRRLGLDRQAAEALVATASFELEIPAPKVSFHAGRSPHTGYCMPPRIQAVAQTSEEQVLQWESQKESTWPASGLIRLGDPTALATVAHELGHHLTYLTEPVRTPAHGKRWVGHFDRAASAIDRLIDE